MAILYTKTADVKARLIGKVRFTTDASDENRMQDALLARLVSEAEGQVEQDLSPRYATPFCLDGSQDPKTFQSVPERPTKELIRTLCELQSVMRVLETDFGDGTTVDSSKYSEKLEKRYKAIVDQLLERRDDDRQGWKYPPLPGLALNWFNKEADDGFSGSVLVTTMGDGDFPSRQINNPSQNFWNGSIDAIDRDFEE